MTNINYQLPSSGKVMLTVFDMNGREVETLVNDFQNAGYYNISFNSKNISSGVYFYKLTTNDFSDTKRMILIK
ncbi:MAG: T9SS type A sorting domain-containing protein [Ignavibacteria bacterium]|nr:T9SS type A sorting domain-containing protein [Ignavibacteria bacterium]